MNRRLVLGALVAALTATTALTATAQAEETEPTTVTFHVENALGDPVQHVTIYGDPIDEADHEQPEVLFGTTNANGDITASDGLVVEKSIGVSREFELSFVDTDETRTVNGTRYALASYRQRIEDGANVLPTITVQRGGTVRGKVLAPSGKAWGDLGVVAGYVGFPERPHLDRSDAQGRFAVSGLTPSTVTRPVYVDTSATDRTKYAKVAEYSQIDYGQTTSVLAQGVRISCETALVATSTGSGAVSLKATIRATRHGIAKPHGTVTLSRGGNRLKSFGWTGPAQTLHLTGQPRGRKVSYQVAYAGGDCLDTSVKTAVTVKR